MSKGFEFLSTTTVSITLFFNICQHHGQHWTAVLLARRGNSGRPFLLRK